MNITIIALALALGASAQPAFAAARRALPAEATAAHDAAAHALRTELEAAARHPAATARPKVMGNRERPGTPQANPLRAYPPSCAAYPLPDKSRGPSWSEFVSLYARNAFGTPFIEDVKVTVWRLPCSSSGAATPYNEEGTPNALTLVRIDRSADHEGDGDVFPTFPVLRVSHGDSDPTGVASLVRAAVEPNTVASEMPFNTAFVSSNTFVLENYGYEDSGYFRFNDAFTLRIDPLVVGLTPVDIEVPAYAPNATDYPDASAALPLDGYSAAQWVNYEFNEGLLLQVTEQIQPNGAMQRQVVFDLLTEDTGGDPLWLVGNAAFPADTRSLEIELGYLGNGLALIPWGTATIEVADCNHLDVTYAANGDLVEPIPVFNGLTTYERLFTANGMTCE